MTMIASSTMLSGAGTAAHQQRIDDGCNDDPAGDRPRAPGS